MTTSYTPTTQRPYKQEVRRQAAQETASPTNPMSVCSDDSSSPLRTRIERELANVQNPQHPLDHRPNVDTPKDAEEAVSNPLFPPLPKHYSWFTVQFYRALSMFLSLCFMTFVIVAALIKTLPSICWVIWSWCQLKSPDRLRPFYKQEKERRHIKTGRLKCDIGYYAKREGLDCEEMTIATEDGFILTMQHIVDRRPGAVDPKSTNLNDFA